MTTNKINMSGISSVIQSVKNEGMKSTVENSKELAAKLASAAPAKAEKPKKTQKRTTAAAPKSEAKQLVTKIPLDKRSPYEKRAYLHPSWNCSAWEGKESEIVALKTLFIDENGKFQLWTRKVATELIRNWMRANTIKSFVTADVEAKFRVFGGGITDVTRAAAKTLEKEGLLSISKADSKRLTYVFKVVKK